MNKIYLYLRLFRCGEELHCAGATVLVTVTPNSISYDSSDLAPFAPRLKSKPNSWQELGNFIFDLVRSELLPEQVSARTYVCGGYEITGRKLGK